MVVERLFPRIDRNPATLADDAYGAIVNAMLIGSINPGDRLIQDKLADELDVSRTPVREALLRLQKEGVIEAAGRRGFVVCALGEEEVARLYEAREAIEGYAAGLAALVGREAVLYLEETIRNAESIGVVGAQSSFQSNRMIHRAVVESTGNEYLVSLFDSIWGRSVALRAYATFFSMEKRQDLPKEHQEILDALKTGDPVTASRVMIDHIRGGLVRSGGPPRG